MHTCTHCGAEPSPESNYCPRCGVALVGRVAPRASSVGIPVEPARLPMVPEAVVFVGHPRVLASLWHTVTPIAILVFGAWLGVRIRSGNAMEWACVLAAFLALARWLFCLFHTYRVTTHRINAEFGIFSKRREVLWLNRVEDVLLSRPFFQRLMRTGNIEVVPFDRAAPHFFLIGIKGATHVYDQLKAGVERELERHVGVIRALHLVPPGSGPRFDGAVPVGDRRGGSAVGS